MLASKPRPEGQGRSLFYEADAKILVSTPKCTILVSRPSKVETLASGQNFGRKAEARKSRPNPILLGRCQNFGLYAKSSAQVWYRDQVRLKLWPREKQCFVLHRKLAFLSSKSRFQINSLCVYAALCTFYAGSSFHFLAPDAMLARYMLSSCVCPSVCRLYVRYCTKTDKHRITRTTSYDSPGTHANGIIPNGCAKNY